MEKPLPLERSSSHGPDSVNAFSFLHEELKSVMQGDKSFLSSTVFAMLMVNQRSEEITWGVPLTIRL
ncbi:Hypothetical predicted protein [Octopus vulgaris]|uniref:Uncharacterized protein n=1 Tax=Octopus vulgaris TaxID=6645 RepID=A0AA36AP48_OCTVU|nr:Hypothetical predicted protein [Octopus vulgaris]